MLEKRKAEWQTEAVVKERVEMILKTLRKRFGNVPQGIEESVRSMSDPIALESLLETALDSSTLEEFVDVLK